MNVESVLTFGNKSKVEGGTHFCSYGIEFKKINHCQKYFRFRKLISSKKLVELSVTICVLCQFVSYLWSSDNSYWMFILQPGHLTIIRKCSFFLLVAWQQLQSVLSLWSSDNSYKLSSLSAHHLTTPTNCSFLSFGHLTRITNWPDLPLVIWQ
jgi:hypothetical protein